MNESVVYLQRSADGEIVEATLCDEITTEHLEQWSKTWVPTMAAFCKNRPRTDKPEDSHWDWKGKAAAYGSLLSYQSFALIADGKLQGMMMTNNVTSGRIPEQFVELWRRNKGWNAEKLAQEAGIDTEEVLEIKHDPHCEPEPDAVFKLAEVFKVPSRKLLEIAGLVQNRTPRLREEAIRFAARSESISVLSELERDAFEAFVAALTAETDS